jgi:hypothetical protein
MTRRTLALLVVGQILFYSCHISHDKEIICQNNFKKASNLAYENPSNKTALDSALIILNRCMECDSIKKSVVELKIRLLITLGKFKEGTAFVDSLKSSDFEYSYKKELNRDNFIALNYTSNKDTISRNNIYRRMTADLEKYINRNNLNSKELQEAYIDLFSLKENFLDSTIVNQEVDSLKRKYPDNAQFFDFLKH